MDPIKEAMIADDDGRSAAANKPCTATDEAVFMWRIMDPNIPKNEQEWWARREIERLRAELVTTAARWEAQYRDLSAAARELMEEIEADEQHGLGADDPGCPICEKFRALVSALNDFEKNPA